MKRGGFTGELGSPCVNLRTSGDFECFNKALLAKQGWRIINNPNSLVGKILKLDISHDSFMEAKNGYQPSFTWRSILQGQSILRQGLSWSVRNGHSVHIWDDYWVPNHPPPLNLDEAAPTSDLKFVRDLMLDDGAHWNVTFISEVFTEATAKEIVAIPLCNSMKYDCPSGIFSKSGCYSVKLGYWIAKNFKDAKSSNPSSSSNKPDIWRWIWQLNIQPKIKIFLWRCMQGALPTRVNLLKKGVDLVPLCPRCGWTNETQEHALRDCDWNVFFWRTCVLHLQLDCHVSSLSLQDWILSIIRNQENEVVGLFATHLWMLWKARNLLVFQNVCWEHIECHKEATTSFYEYENMQMKTPHTQAVATNQKNWSPPSQDHFKVNIGASIDSNGRIGVGGLMRKETGEVIHMFSQRIESIPDILTAEALACYRGMVMATEIGVTKLIVESDNLELIQLLKQKTAPQNYAGNVIANIFEHVAQIPNIVFQWCRRSANRSAHELARVALNYVHSHPPICFLYSHLASFVSADIANI